jgi:tetratricopeptide (TPR) repeat protein
MNRRRILGLVLLACVAILLAIRGCSPRHHAPEPPPAAAREMFDKSKPFVLTVQAERESGSDTGWLARELDSLMSFAGFKILAAPTRSAVKPFHVQVMYSGATAKLLLIAPDQVVERQQQTAFSDSSRLQVTRELIKQLIAFLGGASNANLESALNMDDAEFQSLSESMDEVTGAHSRGFTDVGEKLTHASAVTKLERLARQHPRSPRILGALALAYLSVGGPDHQSLLDLAERKAQQALSISQDVAEAHAALGLVGLHRNQWVSARESLDRALKLNPNSLPALEGLACVLVDAGQLTVAADYARRALALQPENVGARDCLEYAKPGTESDSLTQAQQENVAVVAATVTLLNRDFDRGRELLSKGVGAPAMRNWGDSLLEAAQHPAHISAALQNITEAALEHRIDSMRVLLAGVALRKSDFVFNRLGRLRAEHEHEPTRVLWLPAAQFLRAHPRFERVVTEAALPSYWHEYGRPDICDIEPAVYGCGELPGTKSR